MTQRARLTRDPHAGDEAAIRALVTIIVQQAHPRPLAVILFGSRARGDQRPTSDVDLLLVWPEGTNTRRAAAAVDDLLTFAPLDVDIVATTPTRLAAARGDYGSVLHWAQEQGVVLYQADEETRTAAGGVGALA
jgi:predicted nucleotidyltransferase